MTANLLPKNASAFERAVEQLNAERYPLDAGIVGRYKDPWQCPEHLLPYLAHELSVDTWRDDWSETRKRQTIAATIGLHKVKGTLWAIKVAAKIAGAEVVRATVPPSKTFLAPSLTVEERNAFVRKYPELRLYTYRSGGNIGRGIALHKFYASNPDAATGQRTKRFFVASDAAGRFGRQGYLYKNGVETPLQTSSRFTETVSGFGVDYDEVRQRGVSFSGFASVGNRRVFAGDNKAGKRIFRIRIKTDYTAIVDRVQFNTVKAGLDPMGYESESVAVQGTRRGIYATGSYVGQQTEKTNAGDRIFDRLWLFDPSVPLESRGRTTHIGGARLSMPAYHSEIVLRMRGKRRTFMAGRFVFGQLCASDQTDYRDALTAVSCAKSARDKVLIQTSTFKPAVAGVQVNAGTLLAGAIVENV